jgi:hypothetical protein
MRSPSDANALVMAHETPGDRGFALCLPLSVPLGRGGKADAKRRWQSVVNAQPKGETPGGSSPRSCGVRPWPSRPPHPLGAAPLLPAGL